MKPEELFHDLLGLGANWQVTELVYLKGGRGEVRIVIEDTDTLIESLSCKEDGSSVRLYDHSAKRAWRHLNIKSTTVSRLERIASLSCSRRAC